MIFPQYFWIILCAGLLGCCIGFKKFIWFMSVGYGLAISCIAIALAVLGFMNGASYVFLLHTAVLCIYGLRLGLFLLIRELKNQRYRATLASAGGEKKMPVPVMASMWLMSACLYYMQTSGLFYRFANGKAGEADAFMWIGLAVSALGLILEAAADSQKSAQKKERPDMVATKGLYRMCRCPNYFGEILVWTGVLVSSLNILEKGQWAVAVLGYIAIVYIMFNGAKRLELRQTKRCWKDPEYVAYVEKTPIIIPFLPVYHLIDWVR